MIARAPALAMTIPTNLDQARVRTVCMAALDQRETLWGVVFHTSF
jgi:hypothetical protein